MQYNLLTKIIKESKKRKNKAAQPRHNNKHATATQSEAITYQKELKHRGINTDKGKKERVTIETNKKRVWSNEGS